jgi:hypothetical protein
VCGGRWGNGEGGCIWCKFCVNMYNGKMISVETIIGVGEERYEEE